PRAYLIRTATHLWIDRIRRRTRERAFVERNHPATTDSGTRHNPEQAVEVREAAGQLLQRLAPRERAAVLLKDIFDLSLEETASMLKTTVGAVKAALHRGRGRLDVAERDMPVGGTRPPRDLVERFMRALSTKDIEGLRAVCAEDLTVELVGGAEV